MDATFETCVVFMLGYPGMGKPSPRQNAEAIYAELVRRGFRP